jgi:predicted  nucleic acid-binding Zn-ribbon protein
MIPTLCGAFALVALACALIAMYSARKSATYARESAQLAQALSSERGTIAAHEAEITQLHSTLRKLSGRLGAWQKELNRNEGSSDEPAADYAGYKARLRAKVGLVPGKPPPKLG